MHRVAEHGGGQADLAEDHLGGADAVHAHRGHRTGAALRWQTRPVAPPASPDELELAVELVREAGRRTLRWFRADDLEVERKGDGTPVTAADRDAERFLRERAGRRVPG